MKVFGLAGWSGSGKTTLLAKLLPELIARGVSVSTIKHTHHKVEVDKPGKDSYVHRESGATEVLVGSPQRWALIHENRGEPEASLDGLIARMTPVDLLLVEGFKAYPHDKVEVYRQDNGKPLICVEDPHIVAVASDAEPGGADLAGVDLPVFALDDVVGLASFILGRCGLCGLGGKET
ncbi:MAG: molybdopterin-guanine dinucleotide biosynthesis protein B [Alphaproteobacteria bacterium]|nr:molybdopterin-guanine dinucleotide biosynthesis protein B [Alphaproteobacteria bacterium]